MDRLDSGFGRGAVRLGGATPAVANDSGQASWSVDQEIGRLPPTVHGRGRVTVLDRRIVTRCRGALRMRRTPDFELAVERAGPA